MKNEAVIAALQKALQDDPRNGALWLHVASLQEEDELLEDAIGSLRTAAEVTASRRDANRRLIRLLRENGKLAEALLRAESLLEEEEDPELRAELEQIQVARGHAGESAPVGDAEKVEEPEVEARPDDVDDEGRRLASAAAGTTEEGGDDWASQFDWGDLRVSMEDVVGLEEVKHQIHLRIVAPFLQPEIYQAFGREAGGGLLLYGPPGCGKTFIARATAGELGARFVSVSIHEIVDQYWGQSEKLVHSLFEDARRSSPTVLFFDEFDALGASRGGGAGSQFWKTLVDQMLQEMDGVAKRNTEILLFAATNMPWGVDAAFRRPGRFDRVLFVPPPDAAARRVLLERYVHALPGGAKIPVDPIVAKTDLYTAADLKALCERAAEGALDRSLTSGKVESIGPKDLDRALRASQSTSLEWLATARNYAKYSNEGGQYDDLSTFLRRVKRW